MATPIDQRQSKAGTSLNVGKEGTVLRVRQKEEPRVF